MSENKALDALWDALWEDLRHNATGRPSGLLIITRHRLGIEAAARSAYHPPDAHNRGRGDPPDPSWHEDEHGYVVASLSYENREGQPEFNGAFEKW